MTWDNMKRFIICAFVVISAFFNACESIAAPRKIPTVAVISDTSQRNGTTYLICGAASDIIATDIINRLNQTGRIKAPLLGESMSKITQKNLSLYYVTFFREYKYNYNVDFVNLKRLTKNINADYILMITSGLDTQTEFFKETWWSKWGISSSEPIRPNFKLATLITLIDKKTYSIVWQDLYQREIRAKDMDLSLIQFSPSYSQLAKIKKYSKNMSEYVVNIVDKQVNPWIVPPEEPKAIEMKSRFINEGTKVYYPTVNGEVVKENITDFKENTQRKIDNYKKEREIKKQKHIENVNYQKKQEAERKATMQKIKQLEEQTQATHQMQKTQKSQPQKEERLFDSIRNNIDDMSNSLPPQKEMTEDDYIKPAVQIEPKQEKTERPAQTEIKQTENKKPTVQKEEPKLINPVMNKPVKQAQPKSTQTIKKETKPIDNTQKQESVKPQEKLPSYDWNLQNIYLQKIGNEKPEQHNKPVIEKKYKRTAQKNALIKAETE